MATQCTPKTVIKPVNQVTQKAPAQSEKQTEWALKQYMVQCKQTCYRGLAIWQVISVGGARGEKHVEWRL